MAPADAQDDGGLYQPPRPPLPAPTPYTHPRPLMSAAPQRPALSPAPSVTRLAQLHQQSINQQAPSPHPRPLAAPTQSQQAQGAFIQHLGSHTLPVCAQGSSQPQALPGLSQGPPPCFSQQPQQHSVSSIQSLPHTTAPIPHNPLTHQNSLPVLPTIRPPTSQTQVVTSQRYLPFEPTPLFQPPLNPRVGAAGLPPSAIRAEELPPPNFLHALAPRSPLGGHGSLSCPTSLSEQVSAGGSTGGLVYSHTGGGGLGGFPGAALSVCSAPGPGCWSLPRDTHAPTTTSQEMAGGTPAHERGASAPAAMVGVGGGGGEELKTRSLPTRCHHGAGRPGAASGVMSRRNLVLSEGEAGGGPGQGSSSLLCEEDGFYFNQPLMEEGEEDLYGSSEDLSSGSSILEKLMVWAYYNAEGQETEGGPPPQGTATAAATNA
ncbi:unnamed protein product, partial [Meganyctiphanes norvegica]